MRLQSSFIEITLRHGCSPVNLLHIFRTPFLKNTSGRLLLNKIDHQFSGDIGNNGYWAIDLRHRLFRSRETTVIFCANFRFVWAIALKLYDFHFLFIWTIYWNFMRVRQGGLFFTAAFFTQNYHFFKKIVFFQKSDFRKSVSTCRLMKY